MPGRAVRSAPGAGGGVGGAGLGDHGGRSHRAVRGPQNRRITGVSGRQVSLAWDAPQEDGGSRVTGYEYRVDGPSPVTAIHLKNGCELAAERA